MKKFTCKWDWLNIIFSSFFVLWAFASIGAFIYSLFIADYWHTLLYLPLLTLPFAYLSVKALYHCPTSVEKEGDKLRINFLIGKEEIDISGCIAEKPYKDFTIMQFQGYKGLATRPLIGYWGHYYNKTGKYRFCFTDRKRNLCILRLKGQEEKLIINAPYEWFDSPTTAE